MKMQVKCDVCGKIGTGEGFAECDGQDLCLRCLKRYELAQLRRERNKIQAWLESTHLKDLRERDQRIADLTRELNSEVEPDGREDRLEMA